MIFPYHFSPGIFKFLEEQEAETGGQIQLTDAVQKLNKIQRVFAYDFEGKCRDVEEKLWFIEVPIEVVLQQPELKKVYQRLWNS